MLGTMCCNLGTKLICFKQILQHQSLHLCLRYSPVFFPLSMPGQQLPGISSIPNSAQLLSDDSTLQITGSPTSVYISYSMYYVTFLYYFILLLNFPHITAFHLPIPYVTFLKARNISLPSLNPALLYLQ